MSDTPQDKTTASVWLVVPDYGCEGYGEPEYAFTDEQLAREMAARRVRDGYTMRQVIRVDLLDALPPEADNAR